MWKSIAYLSRPQTTIWLMRTVCWMPKAAQTHTLKTCSSYRFSTVFAQTMVKSNPAHEWTASCKRNVLPTFWLSLQGEVITWWPYLAVCLWQSIEASCVFHIWQYVCDTVSVLWVWLRQYVCDLASVHYVGAVSGSISVFLCFTWFSCLAICLWHRLGALRDEHVWQYMCGLVPMLYMVACSGSLSVP